MECADPSQWKENRFYRSFVSCVVFGDVRFGVGSREEVRSGCCGAARRQGEAKLPQRFLHPDRIHPPQKRGSGIALASILLPNPLAKRATSRDYAP